MRKQKLLVLWWLVLLCAGQASAQVLFTQPEIDAWKTRRTTGPYANEYTAFILPRANAWRTTMQGPNPEPRWAGMTQNPAICYDGNSTVVPGRTIDVGLRDAAFVYLMTGDTSYSTLVRTALLAQAAMPGTDFSNAARWCPTTGTGNGYGDFHQSWLRRLAFAYAYTKPTFSGPQQTTMNTWFTNAGLHLDTVVHNIIKKRFPNRYANNYAACSQNCPGAAIGITHFGGHTVNRFHEGWTNKVTSINAAVGTIGFLVNNAAMKAHAKLFVKEWLHYATFPGGQVFDQFRWGGVYATPGFPAAGTTTPQHGFMYTGHTLGSNMVIVDMLAREGDMELLTYSTTTGMFGSQGGPKTLLGIMQHYAGMTRETITEYARTTATTDVQFRIDSQTPTQNRIEYVTLALLSTFYKDANVKLAYQKAFPPTIQTVGCDTRGGDWCVFPSARFQFGDFENILFPYTVTPPDFVPNAPTGLTLFSITAPGTVRLTWTAATGTGSPVTSYAIKYGTVSGTHGTTVNIGLNLAGNVTGLTPDATYYFVVTALNAEGESAKSTELDVTVTVPAMDDGTLHLSLTPGSTTDTLFAGRTYAPATPTTLLLDQTP